MTRQKPTCVHRSETTARHKITRLAMLLVCICWTPWTAAHEGSNAFIDIDVTTPTLTAQIELSLLDLELAIGLDDNGDSTLTWGEIRRQHDAIEQFIEQGMVFKSNGEPCPFWVEQHELSERGANTYAQATLNSQCPVSTEIWLEYGLLFNEDPLHRVFVSIDTPRQRSDLSQDGAKTKLLSPTMRQLRVTQGAVSNASQDALVDTSQPTPGSGFTRFLAFFQLGMHHIVVGYDHLLFLLTLLIGIGWRADVDASRGNKHPMQRRSKEILLVITSFTVAHSITLMLGAFKIITPQPQFIEIVIAMTIVLAALNNLTRSITRNIWLVAFAFGLLHGFGFSNMLIDAMPTTDGIAAAILSFNIGVEAGQLMIMSLVVLIAAVVPFSSLQKQRLSSLITWSTVVLASYWVVARATEIEL